MDKEKIKKQFEKFILSLEKNNISYFNRIFYEDCIIDSNTLGNINGISEIKNKFIWQGCPINFSRYRIFNNVIRVEGHNAVQSAYVVATVGNIKKDYFHYFIFGGHYLNYFEKTDNVWKIKKMKYCEDMEHGNTYFVSDWWHMIDYSKVNGYDHHPIDSMVESPWKIIKKFQQSDKEEIADIWNKYCWGIDEWDLETTASVLDENVFSNIPNNPINSRKELLELFKRKRQNVASCLFLP